MNFYTQPSGSDIDSSSMQPAITPLYEEPPMPVVYYTPQVRAVINHLVAVNTAEVGWLGLVEQVNDNDYLVYKLYVPKQTVHSAETDIDSDAMANLGIEITEAGLPAEDLYYWGHSHVNMQVSPSGQDEAQIEEFLEAGCKRFIRGIYNKQGHSKVDVYDVPRNVVYQCVREDVEVSLTAEEIEHLDAVIKANVTKAPPPVYKKTNVKRSPVISNLPANNYHSQMQQPFYYSNTFDHLDDVAIEDYSDDYNDGADDYLDGFDPTRSYQ